ncbi:ornithine cyclodeaminase family protein [Halapricum hydrolyticum]|uniref:Ornithine cyclodeaminase family protein n=1 Tax=Halapricum hydrolyticum TaxID=2979991 RepID=A0AAE3LFI2_9EURY|nr:ornithine cyclodeaminase family protein [Halapricum hydrolyticum]MCU4718496.1 ornithine cyclodeaminase family protein [Halapricum hydrolyticum]MCU4727485.1 ornithine cyclodeaminase family protein [Halapricum hydrolyticum]
MIEIPFYRSSETRGLATPAEYVTAVREGYRQRGEGAPAEPRTALTNEDPPGLLTGYLAVLPETGAMGGYTYAAGFGDGDAHFVLPLYDSQSGQPLAVFDGAHLNPYKTGAAGAVGVDALAREDASTVGLFGSGTQARGQLRATATVRDLDRVAVYSPTPDHRETFAAEMNAELDATVAAVASPAAVLENADVVITATRSSEPLFDGDRLEPGTHVTAMGQYHPERRELDATAVARATYVPDLRARTEQDAGAYIQAREDGAIGDDHVHAELGEVVAGNAPGRTSDDDITVFDSGGTAIETVAAAHMLYETAVDRDDLGQTITFAPASEAMD